MPSFPRQLYVIHCCVMCPFICDINHISLLAYRPILVTTHGPLVSIPYSKSVVLRRLSFVYRSFCKSSAFISSASVISVSLRPFGCQLESVSHSKINRDLAAPLDSLFRSTANSSRCDDGLESMSAISNGLPAKGIVMLYRRKCPSSS